MACLALGGLACSDGKAEPARTTPPLPTTTTTGQASTTEQSITTTSTVPEESGGESIGVTDRVTIVVTDPEDDG